MACSVYDFVVKIKLWGGLENEKAPPGKSRRGKVVGRRAGFSGGREGGLSGVMAVLIKRHRRVGFSSLAPRWGRLGRVHARIPANPPISLLLLSFRRERGWSPLGRSPLERSFGVVNLSTWPFRRRAADGCARLDGLGLCYQYFAGKSRLSGICIQVNL